MLQKVLKFANYFAPLPLSREKPLERGWWQCSFKNYAFLLQLCQKLC